MFCFMLILCSSRYVCGLFLNVLVISVVLLCLNFNRVIGVFFGVR